MNLSAKLALVTGSTSGIGQMFAYRLAAAGYNLVLVARREELLKQMGDKLMAQYDIEVKYLVADLSCDNQIKKVENYISSLSRIDLLVNNAGFGVAGYFMEVPIDEQMRMVNVHISSTIRFSKAVIPSMTRQGKGYIINLASLAAFFELPGSVMYSTTKAAIVKFSQTLQKEVSSNGIKIQALSPGFTPTAFHSSIKRKAEFVDRIPAALWSSTEKVVDVSLAQLDRKRVICVPGLLNTMIYQVSRLSLVSGLIDAVVGKGHKRQTAKPLLQKKPEFKVVPYDRNLSSI